MPDGLETAKRGYRMANQADMFGAAAFKPKRTAADIERERQERERAAALVERERIAERNARIRTALAQTPNGAAAFIAWARSPAKDPPSGELAELTRATLRRMDARLKG